MKQVANLGQGTHSVGAPDTYAELENFSIFRIKHGKGFRQYMKLSDANAVDIYGKDHIFSTKQRVEYRELASKKAKKGICSTERDV